MREEPIHVSIVTYLRTTLPKDWVVMHTPNNPRSEAAGARLKRMGMIAGWPDITLLGVIPGRWQPFMGFLEVKAPKGALRPAQKECHRSLQSLGFPVAVVRSIEDVRVVADAWGLPSRDVKPGGAVANRRSAAAAGQPVVENSGTCGTTTDDHRGNRAGRALDRLAETVGTGGRP
jgi:hypothetical protein